jgi:integrase
MAKTAGKIAFSRRRLERLPVPEKGRKAYYDEKVQGLTLYITDGGSRTFYLYKRIHGRPVRYRIGLFPQTTVEQARDVAAEVLGRIAKGEDPQAERQARRAEMTFEELFDWWRDFYAIPHKVKTWSESQRMYDRYLKKWANRPASTISKQDIQALHRGIGADRKHYANRVVQLVRAVYNRGIRDAGWEGRNPATGIKMFSEESRERFLQPDEIRSLFAAVAKEDEIFGDLFFLAILTGARRSNLCAMRWEDIRGDVWRIPSTKSGKPVEIPLVSKAVEILDKRRADTSGSQWVFPSPASVSGHVAGPGRPWDDVRERAGLKDLRWHDLRRSLGSWATITGANLPVVGKMLGHGAGSSATAVYARLNMTPVRDAVEKATTAIMAHVDGNEAADD